MRKVMRGYMVKSPYVVEPGSTVSEALEMMRELDIRHLPVVEDEELKGLVSDRDLREAAALKVKAPLMVSDVMKTEVYVTEPDTDIREVIRTMVEQKIGSTVIVNPNNEILGIFTTTDALEILLDLLDNDDADEYVLDDFYESWETESAMNA